MFGLATQAAPEEGDDGREVRFVPVPHALCQLAGSPLNKGIHSAFDRVQPAVATKTTSRSVQNPSILTMFFMGSPGWS